VPRSAFLLAVGGCRYAPVLPRLVEARQLAADLRLQSGPDLGAAAAALDRFDAINTELLRLSRRNSDVRSLALSLGHERTLTAACDDSLRALQTALKKHEFTATR
jgi:hypothetical protein